MPRNAPSLEPSRYRSLHVSRRALARAAPLVRFGVFSVGLGLFLDQVRPLVSDGQFTWGERRLMGAVAVVTLGGFGLAGWIAGSVLRAASDLIEVLADGAEAGVRSAHLIEAQLVPALTRAAVAMEGLAAVRPGPAPAAAPGRGPQAVREALRDGRFGRAEHEFETFRRAEPNSPELAALAAEIERARTAEAADLRARLDAALGADDPERVIACRDALTQHLNGPPLRDLDRRVVRWLSDRVRTSVRDGTVDAEVVALAARAADSFGDTPEGAALLAGLPRLRRLAGLCPRCERPYRGRDDACPECLDEDASPPPPLPPPRPRAGRVTPKGSP